MIYGRQTGVKGYCVQAQLKSRSFCREANGKKTKPLMSDNSDIRQLKVGVIISQTDPETVWNALRFSNTAILEKSKSSFLEQV